MGRNSLKDIRKKEIVKVFYQVACREGLENTSIAKIAKHMHVNPSLIIHYFETKEDMIYDLIDYILEKYKKIYRHDQITNDYSVQAFGDLIDRLFSREWNSLIDDGVFYSCYAMTFYNKRIRLKFKQLHDSLRILLTDFLDEYAEKNKISFKDVQVLSEMIFVMLEGSYYYLSLVDNKAEYIRKIEKYKNEALKLINISAVNVEQR